MTTRHHSAITFALLLLVAPAAAGDDGAPARDPPGFDFTRPGAAAEWQVVHDVASVDDSAEGLAIGIAGADPYVIGPPRDYPVDLPLRLDLRIKPDADGVVQVFHFATHAVEERTAMLAVRGGVWNDVHALLPPLGPGARLRIDPPGSTGTATVARIGFAPAASLPAPRWPAHESFDTADGSTLESGSLEVTVAPRGFSLAVAGRRVAASHARPTFGYVVDGGVRWVDASAPAAIRQVSSDTSPSAVIESEQVITDADQGTWRVTRRFRVGNVPGTVDLETSVQVDTDRDVAFLPLVLLVAHEGTPHKRQAVFPGLEYLADEPSSSEADIVGPQSRRQVPANHKITFPLMAVAHEGRVAALAWDHTPAFAAVFDSPDRVLASGGHLCGVIMPGSDGLNRHEGELMPITPTPLRAGAPLVLRATLCGGSGDTVIPALRAFVEGRGLPRPSDVGSLADYVSLATAGWLESGLRDGGLWRHAVGPTFLPLPAADAAVSTAWLARRAGPAARDRLDDAAAAATRALPPGSPECAMIGHVHQSGQSLVVGGVEEALAERAEEARRLLASVRPDGTVAYMPRANGIDLARTHDADHANGLSAAVVAEALDAARFAGDPALIDEAVAALRRLGRAYAGGVPRGAQTWEMPLHTPDVLASAHLVRAFTIGHELTGDRRLLDEAVAWAWTGVPFLYLVDPVGTADGPYGCAAVFGATGWTAPVWIGRPVQWCGLVYARALYGVARHDAAGPWRRMADGITATAIRYSWPAAGATASLDASARQGLLPDAWEVRDTLRVDPPINPSSVQVCAAEFFNAGPLLDCRVVRWSDGRIIIHAPGTIEPRVPGTSSAAEGIEVVVHSWPTTPHAVLVTGLTVPPDVTVDGIPVALESPHRFDQDAGTLVLRLDAPRMLVVRPGRPR